MYTLNCYYIIFKFRLGTFQLLSSYTGQDLMNVEDCIETIVGRGLMYKAVQVSLHSYIRTALR